MSNGTAPVDPIVESMLGPQKVSGDAGSVEQNNLSDLIAADKYLASKAARYAQCRGLRFNKLIPDGTVQQGSPPRGFSNVDRWYGPPW